jgi:hypothetical protein
MLGRFVQYLHLLVASVDLMEWPMLCGLGTAPVCIVRGCMTSEVGGGGGKVNGRERCGRRKHERFPNTSKMGLEFCVCDQFNCIFL